MTFSLSTRTVEIILLSEARKNPRDFTKHFYKGDVVEVANDDLTDFTVVDRQSTDYDSYGDSYSTEAKLIIEDEDGRLFAIEWRSNSYGYGDEVISVKHVRARPIDRIDYVPVN